MMKQYPLPHEIVDASGVSYYKCRPCGKATDLMWYRDTSCPVCRTVTCHNALDVEWNNMMKSYETDDE